MTSLLLVGCGKMGGALLTRWQQISPAGIKNFAVIDPANAPKGIDAFRDLAALPVSFIPGVIVFAVKPQQMDALLPDYAKRFGTSPLYLSIAAGKTLAGLAKVLGSDANVVRAMPNLPALIGEGMTALCANAYVTPAQKNLAEQLMQAAGKIIWLDDEKLMDAVTAISGSGPAYLFLFMEALANAAVQCGLSQETATALVRQTVKGSALLAEKNDFSELRKQVTSPGGTTEAAVQHLQKKGFETLVFEAVHAALQRSQELKN